MSKALRALIDPNGLHLCVYAQERAICNSIDVKNGDL